MFNRSSSSISNLKILSGIIVVLAILSFFVYRYFIPEQTNQPNRFDQALEKLTIELEKRWLEGDIENSYPKIGFNCTGLVENEKNIHSSYFQCNAFYMRCFLQSKANVKNPLSLGEKFSNFEFIYHGHDFDAQGNLGAKFIEKKSNQSFKIKFRDTCSKITLAPSVYSASPEENDKYIWDNFGQKTQIDTQYVSVGDVLIWANIKGIQTQTTRKHGPSTDLSFEQKKQYCAFRGGQLLQSRQFDAAVFLPSKAQNNFVYKYPYPWSKRRDAIKKLGPKNCSKIFSRECSPESYEFHSTYSPSWSGVYHSLGSYKESFDNKFYPPAKYKMSSKEFKLDSQWHRLGVRATTKIKTQIHEYNGRGIRMPEENIRSAFRCVYYN
ncbi:MAG: hypothetical protein KC478_00675 [Bacteriovoracaceae bacterium]|nr:hypothetical protein [Bacteriovoracaceae bacterium]